MTESRFDDLIAAYLNELFEQSPTLASSLGLVEYSHMLDERGEQAVERSRAFVNEWEARLAALGDDGLTLDERVDRDLVLTSLRSRQLQRDRRPSRSNPLGYVNLGLRAVSGLFLDRLLPDNELVAAAVSRMRAIPARLAAGVEMTDPALTSSIGAKRALRVCRTAVSYFRGTLPLEVEAADLRDTLATEGELVARAYEGHERHLASLTRAAGGTWMYGRNLYAALLREVHLIDREPEEIADTATAALEALKAELKTARREAGRAATASWQARPELSPAGQLAWLADRMDEARDLVRRESLVSLPPGERCEIRELPPYQRALTPAAAYKRPPSLAASARGYFLAPIFTEAKRPNAANSMIAHESYPGHHVHFSRMEAQTRTVRHVHGSTFMLEGWGVYSEKLMAGAGFYEDPYEHFGHLRSLQLRALRVVIDVGLHTGTMQPADAAAMLRDLGYGEQTAERETERYCADPIQASSYHLGCMQLEELRSGTAGSMSALEFHDAVTAAGALPVALVARTLPPPAN